jgi:ubiquinone biosynthesis protein COQ9
MAPDLEARRDRLVEAALVHVPFDGWTAASLRRGAEDLGLAAADADRLFPGTAVDMIDRMNALADSRMLEAFASLENGQELRIRDKIATLVMLRLDWALPHREAGRRGLSLLSLPMNAPAGLRMGYRTVDTIWKAAGDRSTDYNFYTKRGLLAGVYAATLLYWLDDRSPDCTDTRAFLERRLGDVMQIPKLTGKLRSLGDKLPTPGRFLRARRMAAPFRG